MSVKQGCPSMKYAYFLLALLSASVQADEFFEAEYGEQPDHLTPLDHPSDEYDQRISEHLFLTDGELGRFISRPSFGLESCVSVYEKISDELLKQPDALWPATSDKNKYFITVTQAAENLWYSMAQNNSEKKTKQVEVTRIDREISLRLAGVQGSDAAPSSVNPFWSRSTGYRMCCCGYRREFGRQHVFSSTFSLFRKKFECNIIREKFSVLLQARRQE